MRRRPETTVTVIDSGPLGSLARKHLGARAAFVQPRSHADMPALLRQHRITLGQFRLGIASQYELEAMATGLVVVADLRYPNPDASDAPVCQARSAYEAANQVQRLLEDESARQRLSQAGRRWVAEHHAVTAVVDRLDALYRPILDG